MHGSGLIVLLAAAVTTVPAATTTSADPAGRNADGGDSAYSMAEMYAGEYGVTSSERIRS